MLTSASMPAPNAAMPQAVDNSSPAEVRITGAADFLALLGGAKAAKKTKAAAPGAKPVATPAAAAAATGAKTEKTETPAAAEAGKAAVAVKAALKTAGEAKADGDMARLQQTSEISAAILAALGATAKDKAATESAEVTGATALAAPPADESGKSKTKAPRAVARREAADAAKPDTSARTTEPATPAAKPVKTDAEPAITPQPQRPAEAAAPMLVSGQPDSGPQPAIVPLETQISEARIPLAVREAAQSGIAAPILAVRVTTKDGVAKSIEIRLDPAELGQVDVKLETGHDGKLQAVLSAESADAFELLKKDSGALEAALREAGVDLGEGGITFALNDFGAGQSQQREAAYGGAGARREAATEDLIAAASAETSSWRSGVLDISV